MELIYLLNWIFKQNDDEKKKKKKISNNDMEWFYRPLNYGLKCEVTVENSILNFVYFLTFRE